MFGPNFAVKDEFEGRCLFGPKNNRVEETYPQTVENDRRILNGFLLDFQKVLIGLQSIGSSFCFTAYFLDKLKGLGR